MHLRASCEQRGAGRLPGSEALGAGGSHASIHDTDITADIFSKRKNPSFSISVLGDSQAAGLCVGIDRHMAAPHSLLGLAAEKASFDRPHGKRIRAWSIYGVLGVLFQPISGFTRYKTLNMSDKIDLT